MPKNPTSKTTVQTRYCSRYLLLSCIAAGIDYITVYSLIFIGIRSSISLAVGVILGGLIGYLGLEIWGFRTTDSKLDVSLTRAVKYAVAVGIVYILRLFFFQLWTFFSSNGHIMNGVGLFISYVLSFFLGYYFQSRFVFSIHKRNK